MAKKKTTKNDILERIILLDNECKNPEYAADRVSVLLIIRDIAKEARTCLKQEKESKNA